MEPRLDAALRVSASDRQRVRRPPGLAAIDPRHKRESILLPTGYAYNPAFVGPGRWVVVTQYDHPHRVAHNDTADEVYSRD